jgi:magnesium-dependent phosphatase 1
MHSTALHAVPSELQVYAVLPELVVFDLDQCLWSPEMYTLDEIPTKTLKGRLGERGEGVVGVYSGYETIRLFPGALEALQEIWLGTYPGMRIAAASSADTPRAVQIGRAAMGLLEVLPGVTVRQVFGRGWEGMGTGFEGNMQIGRTPPLSSDKAATHFPLLRAATGVAYPGMLFFDDCGWGDHCGKVEKGCEGVVAVRTPRGLGSQEWQRGLQTYAQRNS